MPENSTLPSLKSPITTPRLCSWPTICKRRVNSAVTWALPMTPSRQLRCPSRKKSSAPSMRRMVKPMGLPRPSLTSSSGATTSGGRPVGKLATLASLRAASDELINFHRAIAPTVDARFAALTEQIGVLQLQLLVADAHVHGRTWRRRMTMALASSAKRRSQILRRFCKSEGLRAQAPVSSSSSPGARSIRPSEAITVESAVAPS